MVLPSWALVLVVVSLEWFVQLFLFGFSSSFGVSSCIGSGIVSLMVLNYQLLLRLPLSDSK